MLLLQLINNEKQKNITFKEKELYKKTIIIYKI